MARFLETTERIQKENQKKKKTTTPKQTTPKQTAQPKQGSQSSSASVNNTVQRLQTKYGGGSTRGTSGRSSSSSGKSKASQTSKAPAVNTASSASQQSRTNRAKIAQNYGEQEKSRRQQTVDRLQAKYGENKGAPTVRSKAMNRTDTKIPAQARLQEKYGTGAVRGGRHTYMDDVAKTAESTFRQIGAEEGRMFWEAAKNLTRKDSYLYATPEKIREANAKADRKDEEYKAKIEQESRIMEGLKQNQGYFGQRGLEAVSSGIGMATDAAWGPASLMHMYLRSYAGARGKVKDKAAKLRERMEATGNYTPEELDEMFKNVEVMDMANAMFEGGIEAASERMFGSLAPMRKVYGGGMLDKAVSKLGARMSSKATTGMLGQIARGTAEEIAEEEVGNPLQALASNLIYGNRFQGYVEDSTRRSLQTQSDDIRSMIRTPEDAQAITARLGSSSFREETVDEYKQAGMSDDEAQALADKSIRYLTAAAEGDTATMEKLREEMVRTLSGKDDTKEHWGLQDAIDVAVSTAMMTVPMGGPTAVINSHIGQSYKETNGMGAVANLARVVKNLDVDKSTRAQAILDRIESGQDISGTQVHELIQWAGEAGREVYKREDVKERMADTAMKQEDLKVPPVVRTATGEIVFGVETAKRYAAAVQETMGQISAKFADMPTDAMERAAEIVAGFQTGTINAEQMNELSIDNPENREIFHDATGIDLGQFTVKDKKGNINAAATNIAMQDELFARAASNYVESARIEQEAWNSDARADAARRIEERVGTVNNLAVLDALRAVDPRDKSAFMLMGAAAESTYEYAWNSQDDWETAQRRLKKLYPSLKGNISELQGVFQAAKEQRKESETPFVNAEVKTSDKVADIKKSGQKAEVRGKFTNLVPYNDRTQKGRDLNDEEQIVLESLAKYFNVNIYMVDKSDANLRAGLPDASAPSPNAQVDFKNDGTIYINSAVGVDKAVHEITHICARFAGRSYLDMAHYIIEKAYKHDSELTKSIMDSYKQAYAGQGLTDAQIEEEVVADIVSVFANDPVFLREISQEQPSLMRRIFNAICDILRSLRNIMATGRIQDPAVQESFLAEIGAYEQARTMMLRMMAEAHQARAEQSLDEYEQDMYENAQNRMSLGYHAGDLGKSTVDDYANQGYGRGSGHFGFGTYFVGNPDKIKNYNRRNGTDAPIETVDFDKYNLFTPSDTVQAYNLHEALKVVDGLITRYTEFSGIDFLSEEGSEISLDNTVRIIRASEELVNDYEWNEYQWDESTEENKEKVDRYIAENLSEYERDEIERKARAEYETVQNRSVDEAEIRKKLTRDYEYYKDRKNFFGDPYIREESVDEYINNNLEDEIRIRQENKSIPYDYYYYSAAQEAIKEASERWEWTHGKLRNLVWNLRMALGFKHSEEEVDHALRETERIVKGYAKGERGNDSAATVFMKQLGYEGVDVRHLYDLDNTGYGSVIYDLKDEDLARKQEIGTARFSITPEQDAAYMSAVESGDTETAQRMIDEAAAQAMPNTKLKGHWYHGTENDFNIFKFHEGGKNGTAEGFGIYLAQNPEIPKAYGSRTIDGYVNMERPAYANKKTIKKAELRKLIKATVEREAREIAEEDYDGDVKAAMLDTWISNYTNTYDKSMSAAIAEVADSILSMNSSDMDVIQEVMSGLAIRTYDRATEFYDVLTETTGFDGFVTQWDNVSLGEKNTIALAFRSEQIKEASPVTYDDNGEVIPLSERFNAENPDIRYSLNDSDIMSVEETQKRLEENFDDYKEDKDNLRLATEAIADLQNVRYSVAENTSDISGRRIRGEQVRTIGKGITADLVNEGYVEFRGRKVKSPEDLAKLCQVLRDPRFETFRVVLTKGDKIVSLRSISSRLPGLARAFESENISDGVDIVRDRMKRTGADGYYLIHNHPSGNVTASFADLSVTRAYLALLGQDTYKGHIILDHDKYGFIDADVPQVIRGENFPTAREESITGQQTFDLIHEPEIDHPLLGEEIHGHADVAKCGQFVSASDDVSVLLYTNSPGEVTGIQEISNKTLKNNKEITGFIRNQGVEFGAAGVFLYTTDIETYQASKDLVKSGHLVDSVVAYGNNRQWSESAREVVSPRADVEVLGQAHDDITRRTHVFESATGVTEYRYSLPNMDAAYMSAVNSGDMNEAQRLVDEAAQAAGMRVAHRYHGTMNAGFTVFDKAYAKVGGNSGAGFYFSTEEDDSINHYQDVEGADNYFKWSQLADKLMDEGYYEDVEIIDYDHAVEIAKELLNENPGTYDVYLNYKNPYVRNYRDSTNIYDKIMDDFDESVIDRDDYEDEWDYQDALSDARYEHLSEKIYEAVYGAYTDLENFYEVLHSPMISDISSRIAEHAYDSEEITWDDILDAIHGDSYFDYVEVMRDDWDEAGYAETEFTRAIVENFGYDAIEDKEVSSKFGQLSREMMTDTEHIIVFEPEQIKLADPVTYDQDGNVIPLSERFDPNNDDIRYSMPTQDSDGNILSDGQMEYFKNSQARDEQGRLVPVYHGTPAGPRIRTFTGGSAYWFTADLDMAEAFAASDEYNVPGTVVPGERDPYQSDEEYLAEEGIDLVQTEDGMWTASTERTGRERSYGKTFATKEELIEDIMSSNESGDLYDTPYSLRSIYSCYLNLENPKVIECGETPWDDVNGTGMSTDEMVAEATDEGYDGVIFRDIVDPYEVHDVYVAIRSDQIKDIRNTEPTSDPDIRYSKVDSDFLTAFISEQAEKADDVPAEDPLINEGKLRISKGKLNFINRVTQKWNPTWKTEGRVLKPESIKKDVRELVLSMLQDAKLTPVEKAEIVDETVKVCMQAYAVMTSKNDEVAGQVGTLLFDHCMELLENTRYLVDMDSTKFGNYSDLADYLRTTAIVVPRRFWRDINYGDLRRRMRGKILFKSTGTDIDIAYQKMQEQWPEAFPVLEKDDIQSMAIQFEIAAAMVEPIFKHRSSEECADMAGFMCDKLFDIIYNGTPLQSYADKMDAKIKALKARQKEAIAEINEQNRQKLQEQKRKLKAETKTKLAEQKERLDAEHEEEITTLNAVRSRELKTQRLKADITERDLKKRAEFDRKYLQSKHRQELREERAKRIGEKAARRERLEHNKYFKRIQKTHKWLRDRLFSNTQDMHIPEQYKHELAELLAAFDLQTVGSKKREESTGVKAQNTLKLSEIKTRLELIQANTKEFHVNDAIFDIIDSLLGKNPDSGMFRSIEGLTIDECDNEELKKISDLLAALKHEFINYEQVRVAGKKMKTAEIGTAQVDACAERVKVFGTGKDYYGARGAIDRIINMDEVTPAYLFKRIDPDGKGLGLMWKELRHGFDKYVRNQQKLNDWMQEIIGPYHSKGILWNKYGSGELEKWRSENATKTFRLESGETVELTPAQMMSLYCLSKRAQAMSHILGAGIVVAPVSFQARMMSDLRKKTDTSLPKILTEADILHITTQLTPEQIDVAEKLQKLMANEMAAWGNEASMSVIGIKLFNEPNYFPIRSDKKAIDKDLNDMEFVEAIRNFGFTKAVQPGASNAIMVEDIFDVVTQHCNNMNLYNAYSECINDFMKVYNYRAYKDDGVHYTTVEQAVANAWSSKAATFIMTFLKDLNGNVSGRASGIENAFNAALGNAKKASVFANARVAAQQPTAITRAFAVIDPKYMKGIKPEKGAMVEMFEHCPIALWKSWGYYDINMGKSIEDIMMNNGRWLEDMATELYGKLDNITWTAIWQMVKAEIRDTHSDVKEGSEEFWALCNDRMSEVVDLTQVVDSPMHRSHAMRDKGYLQKMVTSFMAEPTLTFNMIKEGYVRAYELMKTGKKAEAAKVWGRTTAVALAQAAAVAAFAALVDALRHKKPDKDDEDETFLHLWRVNLINNFKDEMKVWNKIYYVKDIASIFDGWGISNLGMQGWQYLATGWMQLNGNPYARSSKEWYENMLYGLGMLSGVPVKTMMNGMSNALAWFGVTIPGLEAIKDSLGSVPDALKEQTGEIKDAGIIGQVMGALISPSDKETDSKPDNLPDTLTEEQKEDIRKTGEKRAKRSGKNTGEGESSEEAQDRDKNTMLYEAEKAAAGYEGSERDKRIWSSVSKGYKEHVESGDYGYIATMRSVVETAGGDLDYFDEQILKASKTALKKTIEPGGADTEAEMVAQQNIRYYLQGHGMTQEQISSEIVSKSAAAKDLKVAFRIGDQQAIVESSYPLLYAGLTMEDYEKIYENRNRMDISKYNGKYKDRLKSTGTYNWPINGTITSRFGYRKSPGGVGSTNHMGIDIAGAMGDPIRAADGGTVCYVGWYYGGGNTVMIEHDDGTVTQYMHMSAFDCHKGDVVTQGQQIGQVGSTGNSTGPHCHFGVKKNGKYVDPLEYLG